MTKKDAVSIPVVDVVLAGSSSSPIQRPDLIQKLVINNFLYGNFYVKQMNRAMINSLQDHQSVRLLLEI